MKFPFWLLLFFLSAPSLLAAQREEILIENHRLQVEVVKNREEQRLGLGGRRQLPPGQGMLFVYPEVGKRIFWMKGMLIPIDILWLRQGQVVHLEKEVSPPAPMMLDVFLPRFGEGHPADMVLELGAGQADALGLRRGSRLLRLGW